MHPFTQRKLTRQNTTITICSIRQPHHHSHHFVPLPLPPGGVARSTYLSIRYSGNHKTGNVECSPSNNRTPTFGKGMSKIQPFLQKKPRISFRNAFQALKPKFYHKSYVFWFQSCISHLLLIAPSPCPKLSHFSKKSLKIQPESLFKP